MSWVLNRLTQEKGVLNAVLLSSDGMVLAQSDTVHRDTAERAAASASSLFGLGRSIAELADAPEGQNTPRRVIIDLPEHCILVFSAGHNTALAVAVAAEMTSPEVAVASGATIKAVNGLAPALSARERTAYRSA
ncbi:roadblock/LC7 domain-containing protein [Streptomyces sp. SHP 1-2]|nr:roadblock/LC7 domain-containing protein [Streptomyces sp. SID8352]MCW5249569.1 roadblock/LC7 domain-containing protein [Streptomyces sp. SHP 1-2]MYU24710.1 roadblock/LC7 domain-containing protein [Streptomyces sp. SID8352]